MTRSISTKWQENLDDEAAIEKLLGEHYPYIRRLALSILNDAHEADDAAQETFIAAHRALPAFRQEAHPKTWLSAIAINACRGRLRKRKVRQAMLKVLRSLHLMKSAPPSPEQAALEAEAGHALWQAVDELDDKHRLPIVLHYVHELNVPDIARALQLSEGTIHSRLHYARHQLYEKLRHLDPHKEVPDDTAR